MRSCHQKHGRALGLPILARREQRSPADPIHGVDVNRNWNVTWELGDGHAGSDTYHGTAPFSEPETRALARVAEDWKPDLFADVHSGDRCAAAAPRNSARNFCAQFAAQFFGRSF